MKLNKTTYFYLFMWLLCLVLVYCIFNWANFLAKNNYVVECFETSAATSHSVDLPLTTTTTCQNFCGPTARCAVTGQQCFADVDCPGCQKTAQQPNPPSRENIRGDNDAGKLTVGVTPRYSPLTSGYGTQEKEITKDFYAQPPNGNFGINIWKDKFDEERKLFNQRYQPPGTLEFMPQYKKMYTLSGIFMEDGPLPANI